MLLDVDKIFELNSYIYEHHPDIIILNETWLSKPHLDNEIFPNSAYKIFRQDRTGRTHPQDPSNPKKYKQKGGGVLIAISTGIDAVSTKISIRASAEIMTVEIKLSNDVSLYISTCYRIGNANEQNNHAIQNYLSQISKRRGCKKHILVGDFNLNKVSWPEGITTCELQQQVLDTFNNIGLEQLIDKSTHKNGNVLDLLLTNSPGLVKNISIKPRYEVCTSDHFAITFELGPAKRKKTQKRRVYKFKNANWSGLNSDLKRVPWDKFLKFCDAETAWQKFRLILFDLCDKHIPKVTITDKFKSPWFDKETYELNKEKERLRKKKNLTGKDSDYVAFTRKRKEFTKAIENKMRDHFKDMDDPSLISKKLWGLVKSVSCTSRIPEVVSYKGKFRNNPQDQCELFNDFFCDQFSEASNYNITVDFIPEDDFNIDFDHNRIAHMLKKKLMQIKHKALMA